MKISKGSVGKERIHLLILCSPSLAPSKIVQYLKGQSSRLLQDEFSGTKKEILMSASVGKRLFLRNCWNNDRRNNNKELY